MFALSTTSARYKLATAAIALPGLPLEAVTVSDELLPPKSRSEWLTRDEYSALCKQVSDVHPDALAAVKLGTQYEPKLSGLIGYLAFNQPTLRHALDILCQNADLVMRGASYTLEVSPPIATLHYSMDTGEAPLPFDAEMQVSAIVSALRDKAQDCRIHQLNFTGRPEAGVAEMRRFFNARCLFGQPTNAVIFDARSLDKPLRKADVQLRDTLVELMGLAGIERQETDIISSLRAEIALHLADNDCGIEQLANTMNMTPRTLQRHLTSYGHSFTSLRDDVRRTKAISMLEHSSLPIGEISYRLGYTEVSSFYRAFRGWTGTAPGKYRDGARTNAAPQRAVLAHERIAQAEAKSA